MKHFDQHAQVTDAQALPAEQQHFEVPSVPGTGFEFWDFEHFSFTRPPEDGQAASNDKQMEVAVPVGVLVNASEEPVAQVVGIVPPSQQQQQVNQTQSGCMVS